MSYLLKTRDRKVSRNSLSLSFSLAESGTFFSGKTTGEEPFVERVEWFYTGRREGNTGAYRVFQVYGIEISSSIPFQLSLNRKRKRTLRMLLVRCERNMELEGKYGERYGYYTDIIRRNVDQ